MSLPGWMRRLNQEGRVLAPLPAGRVGLGVFAGADRRRRPFATASVADAQAAVSDGLLIAIQGVYALTDAGRAALRRQDARTDQPFGEQHRRTGARPVMEADGEHLVWSDLNATHPLARYLKPSGDKPALLEPVHANAASILIRDYERSALVSRTTMDWSMQPGGKTRAAPKDRADAPGSRLDAQTRVLDALDAVGAGLDRLLVSVLLRGQGMGAAERALDWPARTGAAALKLALERLAIYYRLKPRERVF